MTIGHYVSCFVARRTGRGFELLQLMRAPGRYMENTWQLVTGGIESGETAWQAALRELREEASLAPVEFFQLDVVNTFYLARTDQVMISPMFCALVDANATVTLNREHTNYRWVRREEMERALMWPGERQAFAELCREILDGGSCREHVRIKI